MDRKKLQVGVMHTDTFSYLDIQREREKVVNQVKKNMMQNLH